MHELRSVGLLLARGRETFRRRCQLWLTTAGAETGRAERPYRNLIRLTDLKPLCWHRGCSGTGTRDRQSRRAC